MQGSEFSNKQLFVIGDSHTGAYSTMLAEASKQMGFELHMFGIGGCPMVNIMRPVGTDIGCTNQIDHLMAHLKEKSNPGDAVFFASLRAYRLVDQWVEFDKDFTLNYSTSNEQLSAVKEARVESQSIISSLSEIGVNVIIDEPKPVFLIPPFRCSDWFNSSNPICERGFNIEKDYLMSTSKFVRDSIHILETTNDNVFVWNPFPLLCDKEICSPYDEQGMPLFFDGDHLSAHGNKVLLPDFTRFLKSVWD